MYEEFYRKRLFNSNFWSHQEMEEAWQGFIDCKTYGDYAEYIDLGQPNRWIIGEMQSFYPIEYSKLDLPWKKDGFKFQKIAECKSLDMDAVYDEIEERTKHLTIETATYTCPGARPSLETELNFLDATNLSRNLHITQITPDCFPDIYELSQNLQLENTRTIIRTHLPGVVLNSHCDKSASLFENYHTDVSNLPLNHILKTPEGYYIVFILIAINKQESGHIFAFENSMWEDYEAGDVITFDWCNIRHSTANAGWSRRHMIRICGITKDPNHWAFNNANKDLISYI